MEGLQKRLFLVPVEDGSFQASLLFHRPHEEPPDIHESEWIVETPNSPVRLQVQSVSNMAQNMYLSVTLVCENRADTARILLAARCAKGKFHPQALHVRFVRDGDELVFAHREGNGHIYERTDAP